jgi:outer membrane protein assembly factor BamB
LRKRSFRSLRTNNRRKEEMQISRRKTTAILIALFLTLTIAVPLAALPAANAQPKGEMSSYAFLVATPNPVGIGQRTYISMWVDAALPEALYTNDIRRHGYKLTIKEPDGSIAKTEEWPIVQDTTGVTFTSFSPDQVGTYTLLFEYAGQTYTWNSTSAERLWTGTVFLASSRTITLTVQEEPLPDPLNSYPLPTEYWTRPIEGQNLDWYKISSHWLRSAYFGTFAIPGGRLNLWQRDGAGPNTGHIMWTKPIEFGGVVGGGNVRVNGSTYYSGGSYEGRFGDALIMHGRLYFTMPLGHGGGGGGYICVDLRTGEELWYRGELGTGIAGGYSDSMGELYDFDSQNQHGVGGGILWQISGSTWSAYDGFSGKWMYNLTNVPSGTEVYTDKGEIVRYVFNYARRWMALWNWTDAPDTRGGTAGYYGNQWRPNGKSINTSTAYSWNVTNIPDLTGAANPSIVYILPGDIIIGTSSSITTGTYQMSSRVMDNPWTVWAISDKPGSRGQLVWLKNYTAPANDIGLTFGPLDPVNRVWTMAEAETRQWLGFSVDNGNKLWGPTNTEIRDMQFFSSGSGAGQRAVTAYGNIYVQGYGGELFCYDTKDGTLLWKYNNTYGGLQSPWGLNPILLAAIADGKVYAFNNEHSPNSPLYRGYKVYCIDAYTGEELWTMNGWAGTIGGHGVSTCALAEGFFVYYNFYDNSVYSVGKGPSATSVTASPKVSVHGTSVLVEGTVMDIAAGTKQAEQAARFPNGVPAVADESMNDWMEYVYMQKPHPTNVTGVDVVLTVLDPNGNVYDIGTTTSDASGNFKLLWEPLVPGEYTVIATFAGSGSYWPSYAETAVGVTEAPEATPAPTPEPATAADLYFVPATAGIIIAIVVVGLVIVLVIRKR